MSNRTTDVSPLDRDRLARLHGREREAFRAARPRSAALAERARAHMPGGVPMSWMVKWPGDFPVFVESAEGAHFTCVDGIDHVDLCLGDTGAMMGHSPAATVEAVTRQLSRGITTMLPTDDAIAVSQGLAERFGLPYWQFTLTATDANRHALRYARLLTGRNKVVVHNWCYHGSVDETFATLDDHGETIDRPSTIGPPVPVSETTRVVEFNDLEALERALAHGDVAAVLVEPALTNIGIVLPDPGYNEGVRELATRYGALLVNDETHTVCAGPSGYTGAYGLRPDLLVIGKSIGGGIPCGTFGFTADIADRIARSVELEDIDVGGVGGTLAGNGLSSAAMRATLEHVMTPAAFEHMVPLADAWADGVQAAVDRVGAGWNVTRLGARAEYTFVPRPPRTGQEAHESDDFELQQYLHLYALNRGILLTPFHNMALMSPATTAADVAAHTTMFDECVSELFAGR
ncbi:aspartate aminotransferase family protein [Terracoccus luteus]|uniref:Glutamate-1-semialdehyde aminotransferase n=1 Tax=Terracoccus luteus TaxID=53356 RepID=A0A839PXG2_9MICO|nr:aspartate aminotransferase family protein [Terracoccus luteus]MBB2988039.1 glutamate-1-semialdehyde aminotransferase [Terracoccus luteus]MCP2173690.1 glutamate-1-semialdehyde aminotransferase [Terracoccus luteus]